MKNTLLLLLLLPAGAFAQTQALNNTQSNNPVQQKTSSRANLQQQSFNFNYLNVRDNNVNHTKPVVQNKAVQRRSSPAPVNRSRGLVNDDKNIGNEQPLPRNIMNVEENNYNPMVQAEEQVQSAQAPDNNPGLQLPQVKMPGISFSSGSSVTISSSHNFRKDFRKKMRSTKRKFQKAFAHNRKKKADIATCFAWGN